MAEPVLPGAGLVRKRRLSKEDNRSKEAKPDGEFPMIMEDESIETQIGTDNSNKINDMIEEAQVADNGQLVTNGKKRKSNDSEDGMKAAGEMDLDTVATTASTENAEQGILPSADLSLMESIERQMSDVYDGDPNNRTPTHPFGWSADEDADSDDDPVFPFQFDLFDSDNASSSSSSSSTENSIFQVNEESPSPISPVHLYDIGNDDDDDDDDDYSSDEILAIRQFNNRGITAELREEVNALLAKPKPKYTWSSYYDVVRREHGLTRYDCSLTGGQDAIQFVKRFNASPHVVERMELMHKLEKHSGCVNSLNFNRDGSLLASGSDDTRVVIWDWLRKKPLHVFASGHHLNVFQAKFINGAAGITIVTASRDGMVRRAVVPLSGGKAQTSLMHKHREAVHKIAIAPHKPFEVFSCGEDGEVRHNDLRSDEKSSRLLKVVNNRGRRIRLFGVAHNPFSQEICVCGGDKFVRVYDTRNNKLIHKICPTGIVESPYQQVTCAVYNRLGNEILASYSDDRIYLIDNKNYKDGEFLHSYQGHYNHRTIKGVNFYGPNSEYIVSGSDCGHIFFWDKETEAILNMLEGDDLGVVNCLEPHPSMPILATSGLDSDVKIWTPGVKDTLDEEKLRTCVERNFKHNTRSRGGVETDHFYRFLRSFLDPQRRSIHGIAFVENDSESTEETNNSSDTTVSAPQEDVENAAGDDNDDNDDGDYPHFSAVNCNPQ